MEGQGADAQPARTRLRLVTPPATARYVTCVPLVPLQAAAGAFGDPQAVPDESDWGVGGDRYGPAVSARDVRGPGSREVDGAADSGWRVLPLRESGARNAPRANGTRAVAGRNRPRDRANGSPSSAIGARRPRTTTDGGTSALRSSPQSRLRADRSRGGGRGLGRGGRPIW